MVSLSKNQTISLAKSSSAISQIQFGLGWDPAKRKDCLASYLAVVTASTSMQAASC